MEPTTEGVLKTIEPKDLETCTSRGWVLVKSFQDKTVKSIPELVDAPGSDSDQCYEDADADMADKLGVSTSGAHFSVMTPTGAKACVHTNRIGETKTPSHTMH